MKAVIKHDIPGRMRIHFNRKRFSYREADTLQYYLQGFKCIEKAVVYERTADAVIRYAGDRGEIIRIIRGYAPDETDVPVSYFESSSREMDAKYYEYSVIPSEDFVTLKEYSQIHELDYEILLSDVRKGKYQSAIKNGKYWYLDKKEIPYFAK